MARLFHGHFEGLPSSQQTACLGLRAGYSSQHFRAARGDIGTHSSNNRVLPALRRLLEVHMRIQPAIVVSAPPIVPASASSLLPSSLLPVWQMPLKAMPLKVMPAGPRPVLPKPIASHSPEPKASHPSHPFDGRDLKSSSRKPLGQGVGGNVFKCDLDGGTYIVKSIRDPKQMEMFEREVRAARLLPAHRHLLRPVAVCRVDGVPSLVFADGTMPVSKLEERAGTLSPNDQMSLLLVYMRHVLEGLAAFHDAGMTHGDLKPDNTVLDPRTGFKIIDYGHSTRTSSSNTRDTEQALLRRYNHPGDPRYAPPEVIDPGRGNKALAPEDSLRSADVYAAGRMLQEWLEKADARFEEVHGGKPSATLAAGREDVANWMKTRDLLGALQRQMLDADPGKRPLVAAALRAVSSVPASERKRGHAVLADLVAKS